MLSVNMIIACMNEKVFSLHSVGIAMLEVGWAAWIEYDNASVAKQIISLFFFFLQYDFLYMLFMLIKFGTATSKKQGKKTSCREMTCCSNNVIGAIHTKEKYLKIQVKTYFLHSQFRLSYRAHRVHQSLTNVPAISGQKVL